MWTEFLLKFLYFTCIILSEALLEMQVVYKRITCNHSNKEWFFYKEIAISVLSWSSVFNEQ